jgi:hypothetical protein
MEVSYVFTDSLTSYAIGDDQEKYTVAFSDTVSEHFITTAPYTCGKWTYSSLTNTDDKSFSEMITVSGNSEALTWDIFSENYLALSEDKTVVMTLTLTAE